jgi:hypothetical protein
MNIALQSVWPFLVLLVGSDYWFPTDYLKRVLLPQDLDICVSTPQALPPSFYSNFDLLPTFHVAQADFQSERNEELEDWKAKAMHQKL